MVTLTLAHNDQTYLLLVSAQARRPPWEFTERELPEREFTERRITVGHQSVLQVLEPHSILGDELFIYEVFPPPYA